MTPHLRLMTALTLISALTLSSCADTGSQDQESPPTSTTDTRHEQAPPPMSPGTLPPASPTEVVMAGYARLQPGTEKRARVNNMESEARFMPPAAGGSLVADQAMLPPFRLNTESYQARKENSFIATRNDALSTFAIDVDTASYANVRRYINEGSLPPSGAVRTEEMINYFSYDYAQPHSGIFAIHTELGPAPWNTEHQLVRIGLQARDLDSRQIPPSNLVFLVDVSGSMQAENKLPLLQQSLLLLTDQLSDRDRVAIVVYAGGDRIVLAPTSAGNRERIRSAIMSLRSGGSTHGSSGIMTAYSLAEQYYSAEANNRVILASDGDFNVGITDRGDLHQLIEEKRRSGIYLTVLGFGMGNYHDDTMELLADTGNGNYAYIDSLLEAKKVLVKERAANLFALANDVKIQVEFNPSQVGGYRLIGYENRMLADEDFLDDARDAGEVGIGHQVTALYELIPPGHRDIPQVVELKYQSPNMKNRNQEILTVKLRYTPHGQKGAVTMEHSLPATTAAPAASSLDFRFAAAVAAFAMKLTHTEYLADFGYDDIINLARSGRGPDREGYRAEFIHLVEKADLLGR